MNEEVRGFWERAQTALHAARSNLSIDPHTVVNRAYYAAFYAVAGLLTLEGKMFRKHSVVESCVHRDLVKTGRWSAELGASYRFLSQIRSTGDYGVTQTVSQEDASSAVEKAALILKAVEKERPDVFSGPARPQQDTDTSDSV